MSRAERKWTHVDARTWAGPAAGVARLAGLMRSVIVVSPRTGREASALLPQVEEPRSAAQAAVLPTSNTFAAAWVTSFTHPGVRVSVVAVGKMGRGVTDYIKGPILGKIHQSFLTIICMSSLSVNYPGSPSFTYFSCSFGNQLSVMSRRALVLHW